MAEQPHVTRMREELEQLTKRMSALALFTRGDGFLALEKQDQWLLQHQHGAMEQYRDILARRLQLAERAA